MLYQNHRPKNLSGVFGNKDTIRLLDNALRTNAVPHAVLLHGPSGCGKTTLARILGGELGCSKSDFTEMNSADFRGIDTVRELLRKMNLLPLDGPCRVYLLDECHQLSKDAQEALLKALEDTPKHVYFVLATTDPDKLIKTIRNRCSMFSVSLLDEVTLTRLVLTVARAEGATMDRQTAEAVALSAEGSARMALVNLEKILGLPTEEWGQALRGLEEKTEAIEVCRKIMSRQGMNDAQADALWLEVGKLLVKYKERGTSPEDLRRAMMGYVEKVVLSKGSATAYVILDCMLRVPYGMGWPGIIGACYEAVKR